MKKPSFGKRYLHFIAFLVLVIVLILPCLSFVQTYLHEHAHQNAMTAEGIRSHIEYHLERFYSFGLGGVQVGKAIFDTPEDKQAFMDLPKERKFPILIAGVLSDIRLVMAIVLCLILIITTPFLLESPKFNSWYTKKGKLYVIGVAIVLLIWLISILYTILFNMTLPGADIPLAVFL